MKKYVCKFGMGLYETIEEKNKEEAKQKYIEQMKEIMPKYGLIFDEDCIKSVVVKTVIAPFILQ